MYLSDAGKAKELFLYAAKKKQVPHLSSKEVGHREIAWVDMDSSFVWGNGILSFEAILLDQ